MFINSANNINLLRYIYAAICCTMAFCAHAFAATDYATTSKLSTGKWVKVAVTSDGIYEITDSELQHMGFSHPENVAVYGHGGHAINEYLDGSAIDDLAPVSVARLNGKLCFYAQGARAMTLTDASSKTPHYTREFNAYSTKGYYFLTEDAPRHCVASEPVADKRGTIERNSSFAYFLHERELTSEALSGKNFLGEDIPESGIDLEYALSGIADSTLTVNVSAAVRADATSYIQSAVIANGQSNKVNYSLIKSRITSTALSISKLYYNSSSPFAAVNVHGIYPQGTLHINISGDPSGITLSKLDYAIITYKKANTILDAEDSQTLMGFNMLSEDDCIMLPGASRNTVVWNVDEPNTPVQYTLTASTDGNGYEFSPHQNSSAAMYIAFNPQHTLKKISSFEAVMNQNIHGMPTPHMLIITNGALMEQAKRVAQLHRETDCMDVAVLDQEQIFNEFSSGTPDAMAYRLLCKMLYDRDHDKFKYLMLFGPGSYDNRGIVTNKPNKLLTYQSDNSNDEDNTFTSDDFFGLLDDYSGDSYYIYNDVLRIGVGRYPCANVEEAKNDVDKLIKYVSQPDYGAWRNNALIIAGTGDNDAHACQAEGVSDFIEFHPGTKINVNKVYVDMYELELSDGTKTYNSRKRITEYLQSGQFLVSYVGHATPQLFSSSDLWTSTQAQKTHYTHIPIMSTACCEAARYDSDFRGIGEFMFHNPEGGAIALLATTRITLSDQNDIINRSFIQNMLNSSDYESGLRLGDIYRTAKEEFGWADNANKISYTLLGDPALLIRAPKPRIHITSINDENCADSTTITTGPLQRITVQAQVYKPDGSGIDTDFNGNVTLYLNGARHFFKTCTMDSYYETVERDIYYSRNELAQTQGKVVNGVFEGSIVVPRFNNAQKENLKLYIYANNETGNMVTGDYDHIIMDDYNEDNAITDNNAPIIDAMFINDEAKFVNGNLIPSNSVLHIHASDDVAISTQTASVGNTMKLQLDGGKMNYYIINDVAMVSNNGHNVDINFPLQNINDGNHTLTYTIFDVAGNCASRTISFSVNSSMKLNITADTCPVTDHVTFSISETNFTSTPTVTLKVMNPQGNMVWSTNTSSFPYTWDLHDKNGASVKPGLYKFYGYFTDDKNYGGTPLHTILVTDDLSNKH